MAKSTFSSDETYFGEGVYTQGGGGGGGGWQGFFLDRNLLSKNRRVSRWTQCVTARYFRFIQECHMLKLSEHAFLATYDPGQAPSHKSSTM